MFLIVIALLSTLVVAGIVFFVVLRSVRREQRGFDVKPTPPEKPQDPR